jgi:hypothetical protein
MNIEKNRACYEYMKKIGLAQKNGKCCGEFNRSDKIYSKCLKCNFLERKKKYGI